MENIIIVGAGPAGISAALYAARGNMDPLIINTGIGSLEKAEKIENYYGLEKPLSGKELFERGLEQARALGVWILDAQVVGMGGFDTFEVKTTEGDFEARSVILATGSKRASAKIPGVKEFEGKGYGDFKLAVGETVVSRLKPLQDRFYELQKEKKYLESVIKENDEKAAYFANKTLRKVQKKVGLTEKIR